MNSDEYDGWLRIARRFSRRADEAEDVLHDALLAAAHAGRSELGDEDARRWFTGVLRNQAAMRARTEGRRRAREAQAAAESPHTAQATPALLLWERLGFERLPCSARSVLVLALHGLARAEIAATLGISPEALRQRLVVLRKHVGRLPEAQRREALALAYARRDQRAEDFDLGLIRRALQARLTMDHEAQEKSSEDTQAHRVGTHDPDGHLLVLRGKT
jgi:RNA polymerase sigma-70 factor (ECF subfamily)